MSKKRRTEKRNESSNEDIKEVMNLNKSDKDKRASPQFGV